MNKIFPILLSLFVVFSGANANATLWNMVNDDFNSLSGWGNHNLGSGYAEINPSGQLHLNSTIVGDSNAGAVDQWIPGGISDNYVIGVRTYLNSIGTLTGNAYTIQLANSNITLFIQLREDGLFIDRNHSYTEIGNNIVLKQQWQEWIFDVRAPDYNMAKMDVYLNGILVQSNIPCGQQGTANGFVYLGQSSYNTHTESHTDYFRLGQNNAAVPIPAAAWLLGSGLVGLVAIRRKFKKN